VVYAKVVSENITQTQAFYNYTHPLWLTNLITKVRSTRRIYLLVLHFILHATTREKLESSQSLHTSAKAMLLARWQHHLQFHSGLPYAPLKAMLTKISKWSKIQDSFQITPKIESLVVCAIPDIPSKFQKDPSITFWVILLTHRQTDRQTNKQTKSGKNITSLAEVKTKRHQWTYPSSVLS